MGSIFKYEAEYDVVLKRSSNLNPISSRIYLVAKRHTKHLRYQKFMVIGWLGWKIICQLSTRDDIITIFSHYYWNHESLTNTLLDSPHKNNNLEQQEKTLLFTFILCCSYFHWNDLNPYCHFFARVRVVLAQDY